MLGINFFTICARNTISQKGRNNIGRFELDKIYKLNINSIVEK